MALSSFAVKAGSAGALATAGSGLTATYLAWDHIKYYEVERKVINGEASFEFDPVSETEVIVKTKEDSGKGWKNSGGYYWECKVSGETGINLNKTDFEAMLSSPFLGDVEKIRKNLVSLCTGNRTESTNKKVKSEFKFPTVINKDKWFDYLFGKSSLTQVEREVIGKDLKLTVSDPSGETNKKITITAPSTPTPALEANHEWTCEITKADGTNDEVDTPIKTALQSHLSSNSNSLTPDQKKAKALLVKACAESSNTHNSAASTGETKVTRSLKVKKESTKFKFVDHPELDYLLETKAS